MTSFISCESFDVDQVADRQINILFPSHLFRVVLDKLTFYFHPIFLGWSCACLMPINTCVVNYNTVVAILYCI